MSCLGKFKQEFKKFKTKLYMVHILSRNSSVFSLSTYSVYLQKDFVLFRALSREIKFTDNN